ncbi:MAG: cell division protein FtsZ [Proteobacteria bacterium]|nr:cell division protein FtsZ [Alphaproteobacteria bacterium]MDA0968532.1 cell division protein FtsZ [Pseudomonadota bacterium]
MTINISLQDVGDNLHPKITVLGVGGSGGNAVNNMINANLEGVDFLIANTDAQALQISGCPNKIQLGLNSTRGLGAGMRPDIGKQAAEEAIQEITEKLDGSHMLFVAAGMGGGTGTGAAPVIAKLARERGILTVGVVTKPFHFEGSQRMKLAEKGIEELQQYVDTLLTIPNQNLFRIANEKTTFSDAFKMADDVLYAGVRGVTDLMVQPGMINLDFSDIKTVMSEMGKAMMGTGEASGEGRAVAAAEAAIANPLIDDVSLKGARGLIINITGGKDITLYEVDEAANRIKQEVDEEANIIYGTTCDDRLDGLVRVSIVATGIDSNLGINAKPLETFVPININNDVYKSTQISEANDLDETVLENEFTDQGLIEEDKLDQLEVTSSELNTILSETSDEMQKDDLISESNVQISESEEKADENVEEKEEVLLSNSNIDDIEEEVYSDYLETETESEITSVNSEDHSEEQVEEELLVKEEPSVRRLSLFDNISTNESEKSLDQEIKTEPVISKNNLIEDSSENLDKDVSSENIEPEFNASTDELDEEFNQETEEELLDIPTFLRRQAN